METADAAYRTKRVEEYNELLADATIHYGEEEKPEPKPEPQGTFTDVSDKTKFFYEPVYWAASNKITTGTSATTFSPDAPCTRGQVVTFLWRMMGSPKASKTGFFDDVKPGKFYYDAIYWAYENGITTGTSKTTFSPEDLCTRGHVVTFLWRLAGQQKVSNKGFFKDVASGKFFYEPVYWAAYKKITTGTSATTFEPNNICIRGQIVTFLYRYAN